MFARETKGADLNNMDLLLCTSPLALLAFEITLQEQVRVLTR